MNHPSDEVLQTYFDGESSDENAVLSEHLLTCGQCADRIAKLTSLRAAICLAVPDTPPMAVRERPMAGRRRGPTRDNLLAGRVAAACFLFLAGGYALGRLEGEEPHRAESWQTDPALEVQRTGSAYVAALSRVPAGLGGDVRESAVVEVALSTLRGVVVEAARALPTPGLQAAGLAVPSTQGRRPGAVHPAIHF
jgi:anti-sigma factor RsiW